MPSDDQSAENTEYTECPECGGEVQKSGDGRPSTAFWMCSDRLCDWQQDAYIPDTGAAVRTTVGFQIARWYSEHGMEDRADWVRHLRREYKFDNVRLVDESASGAGWAEPDAQPLPRPATPNHRDGLVFDRELADLKPKAKQLIGEFIDADFTLEEVRYGREGNHTDLVLVDVDDEALGKRLTVGSKEPLIQNTRWIYGYWHIHSFGPYSRGSFIKNGKYVESSSEQVWGWLSNRGWIATNDQGWGTVIPYPQWTTTHAVELKLHNWKKALEQALRSDGEDYNGPKSNYWGYADYQWVVLDAGKAHNALDNLDMFENAGVGLITVSEGSAMKHADPKPTGFKGPTRDRVWLEEETLSKMQNEQPERVAAARNEYKPPQPTQPELDMFVEASN